MPVIETATLLDLVKEGIEQAWKYRRRRKLAKRDATNEIEKAYETAVRVAGAVLFDLRSSTERIRLFPELQKEGKIPLSPFNFVVAERRMADLAEILPTPSVVEDFRFVLAAAQRIDFFQRLANETPLGDLRDKHFGTAFAFAEDALQKGVVDRYNRLVELVEGIGEASMRAGWAAVRDRFVPRLIDGGAPVDHSII